MFPPFWFLLYEPWSFLHLFYFFGLPFSMAPPRRDSLPHIFLLPCRNSAEAFHPATGQVILYENSETWPMPRKHELMMNSIESRLNLFLQTLDTSNLFLSSVPRIMIAKAATNSWKLSLPSPEESNLGENLTSIWHRTCHAEKAELETHETCAPPRTGRLTTFQIRWGEFGCCIILQANATLM